MGETIRKKAMRAWGDKEDVELVFSIGKTLPGIILGFGLLGDVFSFLEKGHERGDVYLFQDLNDIRFLDAVDPLAGMESIEDIVIVPDDIAKERWMVYPGVCGIEIRQRCDGHEPSLAIVRYGTIGSQAKLIATDAQIRVMARAPEMLGKLEEVANGAKVMDLVGKSITTIPQGLLLGINAIIKKARGGE